MWLSSARFYTRKAKGDFWNLGGGMAPLAPPLKSAYVHTPRVLGSHDGTVARGDRRALSYIGTWEIDRQTDRRIAAELHTQQEVQLSQRDCATPILA